MSPLVLLETYLLVASTQSPRKLRAELFSASSSQSCRSVALQYNTNSYRQQQYNSNPLTDNELSL